MRKQALVVKAKEGCAGVRKKERGGEGNMEWKVEMKKIISGSRETDSHRLACSFTNSMLDSLWVQNGCALHRTQGHC